MLDRVSLQAAAGELVVLTGPNGAGKSTLLRCVAGLERPDGGTIHVTGSVGYVPQSGGLDPYLRPDEHFALFGAAAGLDRRGAAKEGRRLAAELGWDAATAPIAQELSGGTAQKLRVISALLGDAHTLLMDEPYQGMDADSQQRFWSLLWSLQDAGRSMIVASHTTDALRRATSVIEIDGGSAR